MRESRDAIFVKFHPKSFEDVQTVLKHDHPLNSALPIRPRTRGPLVGESCPWRYLSLSD